MSGRFRLALLLLAVPLLATTVIAGAYLRSQLSYREAVESASVELARVMLKDLFDVVFVRASRGASRVMQGSFNPSGAPGPDRTPVPDRLRGMQTARDTLGDRLTIPVADLMVYDPTTDELAVDGSTTDGAGWLRRAEANGILESNPEDGIKTVAAADELGAYFTYFAWLRMQGRPPILLGVEVDLDRMGEVLVHPASRVVNQTHLGDVEPELPPGIRVEHPSGLVVYELGRPEVGPTYRMDLFGPDLVSSSTADSRPFLASLSIPPEVLPQLIPGGLPGSPWPLVLATVGIAVLLTGLAAILVWRVRELVLMRERFVSAVSHELRTPLTQMLAYAETLQLDRPTPNARSRAAGVIVRETRRLIHLVENTLDFVRGERGTDSGLERVELGTVVREIVDDLEALANARRATLSVEADLPVPAMTDRRLLHRIILNLVENALTYGPPGQTVRLTVRRSGDWAEILIDDEGPGVPAEDRARVWDAFERAHDAVGGTGLGLAIVRQLVETQGGQVKVADAPGGGARFMVRLPPGAGPADGSTGPAPTAPLSAASPSATGAPESDPPETTDQPSPPAETPWRAS